MELVEGRAKLRNHPCGLRPHEILTGLLGQGASLGGLVIHVLRLVRMLVVILHDTGRNIARAVLLAGPLGESGAADHGHGGAGTVVDQVGSGWYARVTVVRVQRVVVVVAYFAGGAGRASLTVLGAEMVAVLVSAGLGVGIDLLILGILGQVEALDGGGALVTDAANDVGNRIRLVAEVTVRDIGDAQTSKGLVVLAEVQQMLLKLGSHIIYRSSLLSVALLLHSLHALVAVDSLFGGIFVTLLDHLSNLGAAAD